MRMFECLHGRLNKWLTIDVSENLQLDWFDIHGWYNEITLESAEEFARISAEKWGNLSVQEYVQWLRIEFREESLKWLIDFKIEKWRAKMAVKNTKVDCRKIENAIKDLMGDPSIVLAAYCVTRRCNDADGMKLFGEALKKNWDVDVNVESELDQLRFDIDRGYFKDIAE